MLWPFSDSSLFRKYRDNDEYGFHLNEAKMKIIVGTKLVEVLNWK